MKRATLIVLFAAFGRIVGLGWADVAWATRRGLMFPAGRRRRYAVADLLKLLPVLWVKLETARRRIVELEQRLAARPPASNVLTDLTLYDYQRHLAKGA